MGNGRRISRSPKTLLRKVNAVAPHIRIREARERLGLSPDEVAARSGISAPEVWDIEADEEELTCCHSPRELQQLCRVLGIRPVELFGGEVDQPAVSADELVQCIHTECRSRGIALEQFEDAVGWYLSKCMQPSERLLEDMSIDGLQWLCRELHIDWRRVLLSL